MKKLLFLMTGLTTLIYADYNFELACRSDTFQRVEPGGVSFFYFTLTNTGTEPDIYELNCTALSIVPDWSVIYCMRGRCLEPGMPMYDTLTTGEADTTIDIAVYTTGTLGEALIALTARSLGNPALSKSITTRTTNTCAVEENIGESQPPLSAWFINAQQPLNISHTPAWLFDITGRMVIRLAPGKHYLSSLPSGSYLLNHNQRWYKLLLLY